MKERRQTVNFQQQQQKQWNINFRALKNEMSTWNCVESKTYFFKKQSNLKYFLKEGLDQESYSKGRKKMSPK